MRGYYGIGIENSKTETNISCLFRSAHCLGASFIFTIGSRYKRRSADTTKAFANIPLYEYKDMDSWAKSLPKQSKVIGVECGLEHSENLLRFVHPEQAVYVLGAEDKGLTQNILQRCNHVVYIPSKYCLNVAVTGSLIMYDRLAKGK